MRNRMLTRAPALGLVAALAVAAPAAAHQRGGDGPQAGGQAPTRVVQKARQALKAIDRADERLGDGDVAKATSQLAAARRALASAQKTTIRKLSGDSGPGAAAVLLAAQGQAANDLAGLFDEQTGDAVDALATTLGFVTDQRDALVAAITALDDTAEADYDRAYTRTADAIDDEIGAYDDALSDDTLTDAAKAAITGAKTKAAATKAAVEARAAALDSSSSDGSDDEGDGPPPHGGGGGGRFGLGGDGGDGRDGGAGF